MTPVAVRLVSPDAVSPDVSVAARHLLDDEERRRADRFVFDADRALFTVAHALARLALSEAAPEVAPGAWRFVVNRWGRPSLAAPFADRGLHFNLSHTRGLAACAVAWRHEVGVDVEDRTRSIGGAEIARRFFAPPEVLALTQAPPAQQPDLFFRFWTLKEAYMKARGQGISLGLDRFWFDLSGGAARIAWDEGLDERPESWRFVEQRPTDRHALAIAVRDPDGRGTVDIRRVALTLDGGRLQLAQADLLDV